MLEVLTKDYLRDQNIGRPLSRPSDVVGVQTLLQMLVKTDAKAPAWWSQARDVYLRDEVYRNPFLDAVVSVVTMKVENLPIKVISRDTGVEKYNRLAANYQDILLRGLARNQTLELFLRSLFTQDNGAFMYIKGTNLEPSDQPLITAPAGLLHLDSTHCWRTGDPEYPVVFEDYNGKYFKIHESRIITAAQSPSTDAEMFGVGYCFVSRALMLAQHFYDVYAYEGEILGSRSAEEVIYGTGVRSDDIRKAFEAADIDSDNAGLKRYGKRVYMGMRDPNGKLDKLQLKSLPENFNKRDDIEITLTLIALASGGSPGWFYDAVRSGSTKASASESTKIGESKLEEWYINMICNELDYKFLPSSLQTLAGDFDEDNTGVRARIKLNLAQTRTQNLTNKVSDVRTERELQLFRGEITQPQFERLELIDGRTSNGLPLYTLYQTDEKTLRDLIFFTPEPLNFTDNVNDPEILDKIDDYWEYAQSVALNARTINMQNYGLQAMYLLQWTRQQYEIILGVSPRYEFNTGSDTVVDGQIVSMRNVQQELPNDNNPEISSADPTIDDTNADAADSLSGINDDNIIDNNNDQQSSLDKMFTTRKERDYRGKLRTIARAAWNKEINITDFTQQYDDMLKECFADNITGYLNTKIKITMIAQFIEKSYREDGGKIKDIYRLVDNWIVDYAAGKK